MSKKSRAYTNNDREDFKNEFEAGNNGDRKIIDYIFKHGEENKKKNFYLKFYNTLTRVNDSSLDGNYFNQKINEHLLKQLLPSPDDKTLIMLCGRGKMCKKLLTPILVEMGHHPDNVFTF